MEAVSPEFLAAIRTSHRAHVRAEAWVDNGWVDVPIVSGEVSSDYYSMILRDLKAVIAPDETSIFRATRLDAVSPTIYGTYIRVFRGVQFPDMSIEEVPLGVYVVDSYSRATGGRYDIEVSASDLYAQIARARFEQPRQLEGPSRIELCKTLVREAVDPNLPWGLVQFRTLPGITDTYLRSTLAERERGEAIRDVLNGIGARGYFAADGVFEFAPFTDEFATPDWDVSAGDDGTMINMKESLSREKTYNIAVVNGQPSDETIPPVHSVRRDEDPLSPTYWLGPFGKVPYFYSSQFIYSQGQADSVAAALLLKVRGAASAFNVSCLPNPALVAGDVIQVSSEVNQTLRTDTHLITNLSTPLLADTAMTMSTALLTPDVTTP